jgi:hypothetical protein
MAMVLALKWALVKLLALKWALVKLLALLKQML